MSLIKTSIKQSVLVNLLFALILVAGYLYGSRSTKELFPDVAIPGLYVQTLYPGISAREIEKLVTRPIEDAVADVEGVAHIYSTTKESVSFLWVELEPDADQDDAVLNAQARVNEIRGELPPDIETPSVRGGKMMLPVIRVAIIGVTGGAPQLLRRTGDALEERLESLQDVDEVQASGIRERQIRVVVDPLKLEAYGVSVGQVGAAVGARNRNLPGGAIRSGDREYVLRAMAEYRSLDELRQVVVVKRNDGQHVRVHHVAEVQDTFEDRVTGGWVDGKPGVVLNVLKNRKADGHEVVARVRESVKGFRASLPPGYRLKLLGDTTREVDRAMDVLYKNGATGILLVLALLWVFLGLRNGIMAAIGIPFSLAGGVVVMYVLGVTINQVSLFAMVICIGIIVDDAIVVVENTHRYVEQGHPPTVAALLGTKEVMWPVVSTVLTTIAAFLPLLLMTGVFGRIMSVIPKVVVAALVASLIEALVILPSHVGDFARQRKRRRGHTGDGAIMRLLKRVYEVTFRPALKLRYLTFLAAWGVLIVMVGAAFRYKEVVLLAEDDTDMVDVRVEMPQGSSLAATEQVLRQIERVVQREIPKQHLEALISQSGRTNTHLWPEMGKHYGMVTLMLSSVDEREITAQQLIDELRPKLRDIPGPVRPFELVPMQFKPPTGKPVAIRISGRNLDRLLQLAEKVEGELARIEGVKDIGRDYHLGSPELRLHVDEGKAALHGLGTADVAQTVMTAYMGLEVSKFRQGDEEVDIVVRYPERWRNDPSRVQQLQLLLPPAGVGASGATAASLSRGGAGGGLPGSTRPRTLSISDVTTLERASGPTGIRRRDRQRTITVTANVDSERTSQGVNQEAMRRLEPLIAANPDVNFEFGGEWEKTAESLESLLSAFLVALLVIYLILGAQFRSFVQPFVVLFAVPLSIIGVVTGFFVSGNPIDMMALIGLVGLTGIVVNDSLILVDFINQRRRRGMARREAIVEAGKLRLRPILLTTVTTVGGLMPLSMGWFGSSGGLAPMATAIAWGLSFATILILYIVPSAYAIVDDAVGLVFRVLRKERRFARPDLDALDELDRLPQKEMEQRAEALFSADPASAHRTSAGGGAPSSAPAPGATTRAEAEHADPERPTQS